MPVYFDKAKKRWRFQLRRALAGRRIRHNQLLPAGWTRAQAFEFERVETGRLTAIAAGIQRDEPSIDEAVALYIEHRLPHLKGGRQAAQHLAHVLPWFQGKPMSALHDICRQYVAAHPALAPGTVRNRLAYLRASIRYAWKEHGLGDGAAATRMRLPAANNARHIYLVAGELERLMAAMEPEDRALWTLAFYTGLRWRSDLLRLEPGAVVRQGRAAWLDLGIAKTGVRHMVPVHPAARWALAYLPFRRSDSAYYEAFWAARDTAGLRHVRPHDLRHSFASALLSGGATLAEVGVALAHQSLASTRRYTHLYPARLVETVKKLPTIKR